MRFFFLLVTLIIVVLFIVTIEMTLVYNSVGGVYTIESTGQLIPFIIGIISVGKTLNAITIDTIKRVS